MVNDSRSLDWITIKGFKSISCIERLQLRPINLVIGSNGSGKSHLLEVFSFLNAIRCGQLRQYVQRAGGANNLLHFGVKNTQSLTFHISIENQVNEYEIQLGLDDFDNLVPFDETLSFRNQDNYPGSYRESITGKNGEAGISVGSSTPIRRYVQDRLASWHCYHFHDTSQTSPLKRTADIDDNNFLRPDGSNIAAYLFYLQKTHENSYELIRQTVRLAVPFFEDFQLAPQKLNEKKIRLEWKHRNSDAYFDASSLSDGSLRFIALATLLLQPKELIPPVIIMDEPELGLHPYAIVLLASMVKQASTKLQIIFATQSSLLLDNFEPEDVLVAERANDGTSFTRLDSESLDSWLEHYSLGQLWEKNQFGGRPAPTRRKSHSE